MGTESRAVIGRLIKALLADLSPRAKLELVKLTTGNSERLRTAKEVFARIAEENPKLAKRARALAADLVKEFKGEEGGK